MLFLSVFLRNKKMDFQLLHLLNNNLHIDEKRHEHRNERVNRLLKRDISQHPKEDIRYYVFSNMIVNFSSRDNKNDDIISIIKTCWCKKIKLYLLLEKYINKYNHRIYVCNHFFSDIYYFEEYIDQVIEPNRNSKYECENYTCRNLKLHSECSIIKELYYILIRRVNRQIAKNICKDFLGCITTEGKNIENILEQYDINDEVENKINSKYYEKDDIYQSAIRLIEEKNKIYYENNKKDYIEDMKYMFYWLSPCGKKNNEQIFRGEVPVCFIEKYLGYKISVQPYNSVSVTINETIYNYKVFINGIDDLYVENIHNKPTTDNNLDVLYILYKKNVMNMMNKVRYYGFSKDISNLVCSFL